MRRVRAVGCAFGTCPSSGLRYALHDEQGADLVVPELITLTT